MVWEGQPDGEVMACTESDGSKELSTPRRSVRPRSRTARTRSGAGEKPSAKPDRAASNLRGPGAGRVGRPGGFGAGATSEAAAKSRIPQPSNRRRVACRGVTRSGHV